MAAGAQRQMVLLARQLAAAGFRCHVILYHDLCDLRGELDQAGIPVSIVTRRQHGGAGFLLAYWRAIRSTRPAAIIAYLHGPSLLGRTLGRLAGVRVVITSERSINLHRSRLTYWSERLTRALSSAIVTNSHAGRAELVASGSVPPGRIEVIYNGVDLERFRPVAAEVGETLRRQWGVGEGGTVFLLPGRVVAEKNHECLIRAACGAGTGWNWKVVFVGQEIDRALGARLRGLAASLGAGDRVLFAGPVADMVPVYAAADFVVLPSLSEALPNVVLEAMACGRVVIASDIADNAALVEEGATGYLFPTNDVPALAAVLRKCMGMDGASRHGMGLRGRERIRTLCAPEALGQRYTLLLQRLLGAGVAPGGSR